MSCLTYAKLVSEFPCDTTTQCRLTVSELDNDLYQLKLDDISAATYSQEDMLITVVRNNGDVIGIDISGIRTEVEEKIQEAISGLTPCTPVEIDLHGELDDNGVLTLYWKDSGGEHETSISGFLVPSNTWSDDTLKGDGSKENPFGISDVERTGYYKSVKGIVDEKPENPKAGDRWITKKTCSSFGRLYKKEGLDMVKEGLEREASVWRVPTKKDWDKLLNYADACESTHDGSEIGEYVGLVAGKVLKNTLYWTGNENINKYGFSANPAGYVADSIIEGADTEARFWTDTLTINGFNYIKGFSYDHDNTLQDEAVEEGWYSIRLVRDIKEEYSNNYVNLLGNEYDVINLPEIGQAWIDVNLCYNAGEDVCEQYNCYAYSGLCSDTYYISHFDGTKWVEKALMNGDRFNVAYEGIVTEYVYIVDEEGKQHLVKGAVFKVVGESRRMILDAGWY